MFSHKRKDASVKFTTTLFLSNKYLKDIGEMPTAFVVQSLISWKVIFKLALECAGEFQREDSCNVSPHFLK